MYNCHQICSPEPSSSSRWNFNVRYQPRIGSSDWACETVTHLSLLEPKFDDSLPFFLPRRVAPRGLARLSCHCVMRDQCWICLVRQDNSKAGCSHQGSSLQTLPVRLVVFYKLWARMFLSRSSLDRDSHRFFAVASFCPDEWLRGDMARLSVIV